jgi:hypothetical protein
MNCILTLTFEHPYFGKSFFRKFNWKVDALLADCLERYQLLLRRDLSSDNKISLYYFGINPIATVISKISSFFKENQMVIDVLGSSDKFLMTTDISLINKNTLVFSNKKYDSNGRLSSTDKRDVKILAVKESSDVAKDVVLRIVLNLNDLQDDLINGVYEYLVKMTSRRLPRSYYVENKNKVEARVLKIKSDNNIVFDCEPKLIGGIEYLVFNSVNKDLPLKLEKGEALSLIAIEKVDSESGFVRERILIKNLPDPEENNLSVKSTDGKVQMCCDMFVYI